MNKAVFLDRDGVINELILNPNTGEYESPHCIEDLKIYPYADNCLKKLQGSGFYLFLVSNQPSYAKGKTTLENIKDIHNRLHKYLIKNEIYFKDYYYCYHHPNGIIPKYSILCECRKPGNYFLKKAITKYSLNTSYSFIIGDCDSDIECGQKSGLKTILIKNSISSKKQGKSNPDFSVNNLLEASNLILKGV